MKPLYKNKPKRLFTFGCSFTSYSWATWANILAYELDVPFYNFGKPGAGNYYIANQISQADAKFNFTKDDLVIVCWTSVSREDRYKDNTWQTPGNIYTQDTYNKQFVKDWADETHFAMRDFSMIKLVDDLLTYKTQHHHLQMLDLTNNLEHFTDKVFSDIREIRYLKDTFSSVLDKLQPSFYDVLWNGDVQNKLNKDHEIIHKNFHDGHPSVTEHFEYLEKTFDYAFSDNTRLKVEQTNKDCINYLKAEDNFYIVNSSNYENKTWKDIKGPDWPDKFPGLSKLAPWIKKEIEEVHGMEVSTVLENNKEIKFDQKVFQEAASKFTIVPSRPLPLEILH